MLTVRLINRVTSILVLLCVLFCCTKSGFSDSSTKPIPGKKSADQKSEIEPAEKGKPALRVFSDKDGLPQSTPLTIAFDHKGYLWVGTQNGAAYYNGQKWNTVDLPNKTASKMITDILVASDGSIWLSRQGGGISILKGGLWSGFDANSGLPSNVVWNLMETVSPDGEHVYWAATSEGVARLQSGKWKIYNTGSGLPSNETFCLLETGSSNGSHRIWAGTSGGLALLEGDKWTFYDKSTGLPDNRVQSLLESVDEDGERVLWAGTNGGVASLKQGKWTVYDTSNGLPYNTIPTHGLVETVSSDGGRAIWVATYGGGLARLQNGKWTIYNTGNGLPHNTILSLYESATPDGRRTLWVGTTVGLVQFFNDKWITYDESSGLPNNIVSSLSEAVSPDGGRGIWVGTYGGGVARLQDGKWTIYNTRNGLPNNNILSLLETRSGDSQVLWVGMGGGLARLEAGKWTLYDTANGLPNNYVNSLLETVGEDGSRSLWAGTFGGLARLQNGKWTVYDTGSGLPNNVVRPLLETVSPEGSRSLWAGTEDGLARFEKGKWTVYNTSSGLPNNSIYSLMESVSPEGRRVLWVGTSGGVCRMDLYSESPRMFILSETTSPALPDNFVYQIREDSSKRIYLFTNKGVARLSARNTDDSKDRPYDIYTFTTEDGLPSNECNQNGSMIDSRGCIWAGTMGGLAILDPSRAVEDHLPKPLYIERTIQDGKERALSNASLSYKENNITFEFALLSFFREKETRYRTQLVGFEEKPSEWAARSDRVYTNLPGGDYLFKVWGRDYAGNITGPEEIRFKIRVAPWQTWWAFLFYFTGLAGIGYGGYRYRLNTVERRYRLERAVEIDRKNRELESKNEELAKQKEALSRRNEELIESNRRADRIFSALADALPGTVLDGKYQLDKKIGSGGFGVVYRATHLVMKRPVAVKVFKPAPGNDSALALDRFRLEAVSACRINHPNAVAVLDSGTSSEGIAYLVMELLQGRTLTRELKRGPLSIKRAAQILLPVCEALAKAHSMGIVHRDIKPDNIFLHCGEDGEVVKVVDFGIAKLMETSGSIDAQSLTATGGVLGTPTYMSPERLEGKRYDGRSDVYALGVVLYEMLCGRPPFRADSGEVLALVQMHLTREPKSPREFNPAIPEPVESVIMRVLAKAPEKRPTAKELGAEFIAAAGIDAAEIEKKREYKGEIEDGLFAESGPGLTREVYRQVGNLLESVLQKESEHLPELQKQIEELAVAEQEAKKNNIIDSERWEKVKDLFISALEYGPEDRASFLEGACAGDVDLRQRVEELIAADENHKDTKNTKNFF